jgi:hypothetical protein
MRPIVYDLNAQVLRKFHEQNAHKIKKSQKISKKYKKVYKKVLTNGQKYGII